MNNSEIYQSISNNEGIKLPSVLGILARQPNEEWINPVTIQQSLAQNNDFKLISFEKDLNIDEELNFTKDFHYIAQIEYEDEEYLILLSAHGTDNLDLSNMSFGNFIDEESLRIAGQQTAYLESAMRFGENPMVSFLLQLKIMNAIVPEASILIDFSSYRELSPYWLKMTASSSIPPSPDYLYRIDSVYDEKPDGRFDYWLHTHGLHRCGSVELEIANIHSYPQEMYNLLNTTAHMFIMEPEPEGYAFQVGYDGLGINLCWTRWEEAVKQMPENTLGGFQDHEETDEHPNVHAGPSGILSAVEEGILTSPEIYALTLKDNPIMFVRTDETIRMTALARERFNHFSDIFNQYGKSKRTEKGFFKNLFKKDDENPWSFIVKIGLLIDDAETESDKEHLWFEVEDIHSEQITAKLLNEPYWIASLKKGDIKTYPAFEVLTDWVVYGPEAQYTPDSIYLLI